ncbi:acyl-phosphate glycerol 3-phosphate acyltransferase [Bacillaceae bacterium SIJ1]|uniref:lysophospholipid acyltransferase family protein n=1 Tax=Litoribacterium kuwaitense TaxID=1398745 RepID=UPI0013EE0FAD|nr:lysophospholipid acyltransferase family protein [Litoribacterium kuwaitense]NGP44535.1 acyl-phosphate glycerol 3-phosphate acyltransferase [Litoribacterium kuwaitense]
MRKANKLKAFEAIFSMIVRRMLQKHFQNIYVSTEVPALSPHKPTLIYANHSNWWDGLVLFYFNRYCLQTEAYMMMHEKGLKQHPYFSMLGAFSVDKTKPKDIVKALNYAKKQLDEGKAVWLFPQGDEYHQDTRPLHFEPGLAYLSTITDTTPQIFSVALYYTYLHERKPVLFIDISEELQKDTWVTLTRKERTRYFQQVLTLQLNGLQASTIENEASHMTPFKQLL